MILASVVLLVVVTTSPNGHFNHTPVMTFNTMHDCELGGTAYMKAVGERNMSTLRSNIKPPHLLCIPMEKVILK